MLARVKYKSYHIGVWGYSASGRETAKLEQDAKRRPDGSPRADIAFLAALGVLSASMYLPKRRALPFLRGATSKWAKSPYKSALLSDYVNNGYIIGNVETSTPSHMVIRPSMVMFILLVELVNSDH